MSLIAPRSATMSGQTALASTTAISLLFRPAAAFDFAEFDAELFEFVASCVGVTFSGDAVAVLVPSNCFGCFLE